MISKEILSPKIARRLLCFMRNAIDHESLIGDFDELYQDIAHKKGVIHARIWYWSQIAKTIPGFAANSIRKSIAMSKSYMKVTIRSFIKNKLFSTINASGLAIGMVCCILILLYVQDELSYDRYHENADNIHRVLEFIKKGDVGEESSSMPLPAGPVLLEEYPHFIKSVVRFFNKQVPSLPLQYEDKSFNETRFFFTDSTVFNIFSFRLIKGNPDEALKNPFSIVMTEDMAEKYFGPDEPIGKIIRIENQFDFQVTGIVENTPLNSHFKFDFLASWSSLQGGVEEAGRLRGWVWNPAWTYVLLHDNVNPEALEAQFPGFVQKYMSKDYITMHLQPLTDIHLHSKLDFEIEANSDVAYVYIFSGIGIAILLIACVNFMNLTTSRSLGRAKEIGVRKVVGARKVQLVKQFLGESVFVSCIAMITAVIMTDLLIPSFNAFTGKNVGFDVITDWQLTLGLTAITFIVGIASGLYPAFYLSGFGPAGILKGSGIMHSIKSTIFRKSLVVVQFTISIVLIIAATTANRQLHYMMSADLGFDKTGVIVVPRPQVFDFETYKSFKNRILQNPDVHNVTAMEGRPGIFNQTGAYEPEGINGGEQVQLPRLRVATDFTKTLGMEIIAGKAFDEKYSFDRGSALIINEYAAKTFGWTAEEAIGKSFGGSDFVHGVVKDFNFTSLHKGMNPFVLDVISNARGFAFSAKFLGIKLNMRNPSETLQFIEEEWGRNAPGVPFEFMFLDAELDKQYRTEQKLSTISKAFSSLAIFIACLGLFALAAFTIEQKTKEIGIRKVLGARVSTIAVSLSREFTNLVVAANLIAFPLGYYLINSWLQTFAYRVNIGTAVFIVSGIIVLVIAMLTVSYQSIKAALINPVTSLRSE